MILYLRTETPTTFIYTLRSRALFLGVMALIVLLIILFVFGTFLSSEVRGAVFLIWLLLVIILGVDTQVGSWQASRARFQGKSVTIIGNRWRKNWSVEIEK